MAYQANSGLVVDRRALLSGVAEAEADQSCGPNTQRHLGELLGKYYAEAAQPPLPALFSLLLRQLETRD